MTGPVTQTGFKAFFNRDRLSPSLAKMPRVLLRIAIGVAAAAQAAGYALVGLLIGGEATTGCMFACREPNPLIGIPILIGTAAAVTLGLGALWWAFVDRYWRTVFKMLGIGGSIGAVLLVVWVLWMG